MSQITLNLNKPYEELLAAMTPTKVVRNPRPGTFEAPQTVVIPPLNTDIRFASVLPKKHLSPQQYISVATSPLPVQWDWRNEYAIDSPLIAARKKRMTKVPNQGMCGSCWAVAAAGLISDLFAFSGIVNRNPDISISYSLSCYPQAQCGGGNPAELLKDIERSGISTNKCMTYGWCLDDKVCGGKGSSHFDAGKETVRLNQLIPKCKCGPDEPVFFIKDSELVVMENDNHDVAPLIRQQIFRTGPVIGGYHVLKNFMSGDFTATGGVYFEGYNYETDQWYAPGDQAEWTGSHAIVVIGWGMSPLIDMPLPDGRSNEVNVPYWYCRTSWGENWGIDKGFFRIAMYPYNKRSQFERMVVIQPQNAMSGGFVMCSPARVENYAEVEEENNEGIFSGELTRNDYAWSLIGLLLLHLIVLGYISMRMYKK